MENKTLIIGGYKDAIILIKQGNCLTEIPVNYESSKPTCPYGILTDIGSDLVTREFSKELAKVNNWPSTLATNSNWAKAGDILPELSVIDPNNQHLVYFLVLDSFSSALSDDEKCLFKDTLLKALQMANNEMLDAVVIRAISSKRIRFPPELAVDLQFEALEQFIESTPRRTLNLFTFMIEREDEKIEFDKVAKYRMKKYSCRNID